MKLATLDIKLQANGQELPMNRFEFNHVLVCLGEKVTPYGSIPADEFRHKLTKARQTMQYAPQEFTASETTLKVGKDMVTFAAINADKLRAIFTKLWVFAERAGDKDITY